MVMVIKLLFIIFAIITPSSSETPPSPCPSVFEYELYSNNHWYGYIKAPNPGSFGSKIYIETVMALPWNLPGPVNTGQIMLVEHPIVALDRLDKGKSLDFRIIFPYTEPLPYILKIELQNKVICSGVKPADLQIVEITIGLTFKTGRSDKAEVFNVEGNQVLTTEDNNSVDVIPYTPLKHEDNDLIDAPNKFFKNEFTTLPSIDEDTFTYPSTRGQSSSESLQTTTTTLQTPSEITCGVPSVLATRIAFGSYFSKGEWPWLVAIFRRNSESIGSVTYQFICGSTLISRDKVLTAGHCTVDGDNKVHSTRNFQLKMGLHHLTDDYDEVVRSVAEVMLHEGYKSVGENNIAILKMKSAIEYGKFVLPACIWDSSGDQRQIDGTYGSVIGWGRDERDNLLDEPRVLELPLVSMVLCRVSGLKYFPVTSNKTFCGGALDGSGPCRGDGGGGLFVFKEGRWFLRGIVSASLAKRGGRCDLESYTVYTDVAKYREWIKGKIES